MVFGSKQWQFGSCRNGATPGTRFTNVLWNECQLTEVIRRAGDANGHPASDTHNSAQGPATEHFFQKTVFLKRRKRGNLVSKTGHDHKWLRCGGEIFIDRVVQTVIELRAATPFSVETPVELLRPGERGQHLKPMREAFGDLSDPRQP